MLSVNVGVNSSRVFHIYGQTLVGAQWVNYKYKAVSVRGMNLVTKSELTLLF